MKHELPFPVRRAKHGGRARVGRRRATDNLAKARQQRAISLRRMRWTKAHLLTCLLRISFAVAFFVYLYLSLAYLPEKFRQFGIIVGLVGFLAITLSSVEHGRHAFVAFGDVFAIGSLMATKVADALDRTAARFYGLADRIHRWIDKLFE